MLESGLKTSLNKPLVAHLVSFGWGFAEATCFFIVPDVWLTRLALQSRAKIIITNIIITVLGATLGGAVMYYLGLDYFTKTSDFLEKVPAISSKLVSEVGASLSQDGSFLPMLAGAFSGTPYKIYATWAGYYQLDFIVFIMATVFARLPRFIIVVMIAASIQKLISRKYTEKTIFRLHLIFWSLFYICYFYMMATNT